MASGHVVVVDDQPPLRHVLTALLRTEGFTVSAAASGHAALAFLRSEPSVDSFLIDLFMPGMSGRSLVEAIRRRARYAGVPIVLLTGAADHTADYPAAELYQAVVVKPFDLGVLVRTLQSLIPTHEGPVDCPEG